MREPRSSDSMLMANASSVKATTRTRSSFCGLTTGCVPPCAATSPVSANPKSMPRFQACCVPRRFKPGFAPAHPSNRSRSRPGSMSPGWRGSPTRCCWNARARPSWQPRHILFLPTGPRCSRCWRPSTTALISRGLDPDGTNWDAWRNEDGRWTVQLSWKAGLSDNVAHFRFTPGAHGGTATAFDDAACELIDPDFARPLRPVAAVAPLEIEEPELPMQAEPEQPEPAKPAPTSRPRKGKPPVPAWEDVLLGVRSSGQR